MSADLPPADVPLLLLPVHLETHLAAEGAGEPAQLLVRVFPDDVHVDTHEPGLTPAEEQAGRRYWQEAWRAGTPDGDAAGRDAATRRRDAWSRLHDRLGPPRARWVAEALRPRNPASRPTAPVPADEPLPVEPDHPAVDSRSGTWTRAARARLLPDQWLVLGHRDGRRVLEHVGPPVEPSVAVGPDPSSPAEAPEDEVAVDPATRWVVDLAEAERVGMALRVPLDAETAQAGLDTLVVVGVRAAQDPGQAATEVADLLLAHRSTDGLGLVAPWTATNATEDPSARPADGVPWDAEGPAGVAAADPDGAGDGSGSSGPALLARALGLPAPLPVAPPEREPQRDAHHTNAVLWWATWGYALEHMLGTLPDATVDAVRRWWVEHVRPAGPLPTLRVGAQPYGVLPVAALDRWAPADDVEAGLLRTLRALRDRWREAVGHVPRLVPGATGAAAQRDLVGVLGQEAVSGTWDVRVVLDRTHARHVARGTPEVDLALHTRVRDDLVEELGLGGARLADLVLGRGTVPLRAPCPGPRDEDEEAPRAAEVAAWLRDADVAALVADDGPDLSGSPGALLLRHSVLTAYASVARSMLVAEGVVAPAGPEHALVGEAADGGNAQPPHVRTLGGFLDHALPGTSEPLRAHVHRLGGGDHALAAPLDDVRAGLDHLSRLPWPEVERLVAETVDACSHRLDAWVTSVAAAALARRRATRPDGVRVGAVGWVEHLRPGPELPTVAAPEGEHGPLLGSPGSPGHVHAPSLAHATTAAVLRSGHIAHPGTAEQPGPLAVDLSSRRVRLAQELQRGVRDGQPLAALLGYRFERGLHERGLHAYVEQFRLVAPLTDLYEARARVGALEVEVAEAKVAEAQAQTAFEDERASRDALQAELDELPIERELRDDADAAGSAADRVENEQRPRAQAAVNAAEAAWQNFIDEVRGPAEPDPDPELIEALQERCREAHKELNRIDRIIAEHREEARRLRIEAGKLPRRRQRLNHRLDAAEDDVAEAREVRDAARTALTQAQNALAEAEEDLEDLEAAGRERLLVPPTTRSEAMENIAARDVVDGLAMLRRHEDGRVPWGERLTPRLSLPDEDHPDAVAIRAELALLEDAVDALGDAAVAEAVFQTVQGDPERAAAALDAAGRASDPPPDLDVLRTPRGGVGVTHRVLVLLPDAAEPASGWAHGAGRPRAVAEPRLEAWAGRLLGDPRGVRWSAVLERAGGGETAEVEVSLADVGLCALDVVHGAGAGGAPSAGLLAALRDHARRSHERDAPADAVVRVLPGGLAAVLEVAYRLRSVLAESPALGPTDLAPPEGGAPGADPADEAGVVDVEELGERAVAVVGALRAACDRADEALDREAQDVTELRDALRALAAFGVHVGVDPGAPGSADRLVGRCQAAREDAGTRLREAQVRDGADDAAEHVRRVRAVLGESFAVLPVVRHDRPVGAVLGEAPRVPDPFAPLTWVQRAGRVREGVDRLTTLLLCTESMGTQAPDLRVAQLPHIDGDRWIALPTDGTPVASGRVSLVAHRAKDVEAVRAVCGLVVDEWSEVVPAASVTTGVAVPSERPRARAPQCLLLAVSPDDLPEWDLDTLEATLLETIDLSHLRAVDPDALAHVDDLTFLLPAVHVAVSSAGDAGTVSTDLVRAAADASSGS